MTTTNTTNKVKIEGTDIQTAFAFGFPIFDSSELVVNRVIRATGVKTLQVEGAGNDYTVVINTITEGGTVNFNFAPPVEDDVLIQRILPITQPTDLPNRGSIQESQLENEYDRSRRIDIQLQEQLDRALLQDVADLGSNFTLPSPVADKAIGWNPTADGLVNLDVSAADAAISAAAALVSENNAATSETNAATSATNAATSETNAATSETNAAASAASVGFLKDGSEPQMRILRAVVNANATINAGTGFTIIDNGTGDHTATHTATFAGRPAVVCSVDESGVVHRIVFDGGTAGISRFKTFNASDVAADAQFSFVITGPN